MQGSIYTTFSEMVIEKMGMTVWNDLLEKIKPGSDGVYTKGMQYEDAEIMAYVSELSTVTKIDAPTLVKTFGEYLFIHLYNSSPTSLSHINNLKDFLMCIDNVIHKEVQRIYPDAYLPTFNHTERSEGDLVMFYHSKRKLCHLSEGLITSAAKHFEQAITIDHPECMHDGADKCKLVVHFETLHE
jgi:predicted hydrocarbon binding protein